MDTLRRFAELAGWPEDPKLLGHQRLLNMWTFFTQPFDFKRVRAAAFEELTDMLSSDETESLTEEEWWVVFRGLRRGSPAEKAKMTGAVQKRFAGVPEELFRLMVTFYSAQEETSGGSSSYLVQESGGTRRTLASTAPQAEAETISGQSEKNAPSGKDLIAAPIPVTLVLVGDTAVSEAGRNVPNESEKPAKDASPTATKQGRQCNERRGDQLPSSTQKAGSGPDTVALVSGPISSSKRPTRIAKAVVDLASNDAQGSVTPSLNTIPQPPLSVMKKDDDDDIDCVAAVEMNEDEDEDDFLNGDASSGENTYQGIPNSAITTATETEHAESSIETEEDGPADRPSQKEIDGGREMDTISGGNRKRRFVFSDSETENSSQQDDSDSDQDPDPDPDWSLSEDEIEREQSRQPNKSNTMKTKAQNEHTNTEFDKSDNNRQKPQSHPPAWPKVTKGSDGYFQCLFCCGDYKKSFQTKVGIQLHMGRQHREELEEKFGFKVSDVWHHKCGMCEEVYQSRLQLEIHQLIHTKEKPFPCQTCDRSFTQKSALTRHNKSFHSKEPQFECLYCNIKFKKEGKLREHKRLHHPQLSKRRKFMKRKQGSPDQAATASTSS